VRKRFFDAADFGARGDNLADDTAAFEAAVAAASAQHGGTVTAPPGVYRLTRTLQMRHNVGLDFAPGGWVDGGRDAGGTRLLWCGPEGGVMVRCWDAECVTLRGLHLDGRGVPGTVGLYIDSDNAPETHQVRAEDFWVGNLAVGVQVGSDNQQASDQVTLRSGRVYNCSKAGLLVWSQGAITGSVVECVHFRQPAPLPAPCIDLARTPLNFALRGCVFGCSCPTPGGAAVVSRYPTGSGGQPAVMDCCEFECPWAFWAPPGSDEQMGGVYVWTANSFSGCKVLCEGRRRIVSVGNQFGRMSPLMTHPRSLCTSVGDTFGETWEPWRWEVAGRLAVLSAEYGQATR
jgi:hypothetical protein